MINILRNERILGLAAAVFCLGLVLPGFEWDARGDDAVIVAPLVTEQTFAVIKVDTANLELPELPDAIASLFPGGPEQFQRRVAPLRQSIAAIAEALHGEPAYGTIAIPYSPTHSPSLLLLARISQADARLLVRDLGVSDSVEIFDRDGITIAVPKPDKGAPTSLETLVPAQRAELADAFASVDNYPVQLLLLPPDFLRRTVADLLPTLPAALGGGPSRVLLDGCLWAALGVNPAEFQAELVIKSASDQAAREFAAAIPKLAEAAYNADLRFQKHLPRESLKDLASLVHLSVEADRVVIRLAGKETADSIRLLATIAGVLKGRVDERENMNKFKQIMLALHNYHDAYRMFPPRDEVRNKQGKSGLSWRVHILPYLEQQALYEKFHLDEPWDSPHNKPLIAEMPKIYHGGELGLPPGHTTFQAPVGKGTVFGGEKACRMYQISDGTSNTIALLQTKLELAVPWTAPQDCRFDPKNPAEGLAVDGKGLFLSAVCDGSIRRITATIDPEMLLRMFQKNDGKPVEW